MDVKSANALLEQFTNGMPGVALGTDIFTFVVRKAVDLAKTVSAITYPTTSLFATFPINYTAEIDGTQMTIDLDSLPRTPPDFDEPLLIIKDISFVLTVLVGKVPFSIHRITYSEITGGISVDKQKVTLNGKRSVGKLTPVAEPWKTMTTLPDGSVFTQDLKDDWKVNDRAVTIIAKDTIGPKLLEAVQLPDVLKMIVGFQFVGPITVGGAKDLVMFAGPASWVETCPRRPAGSNDIKVAGVPHIADDASPARLTAIVPEVQPTRPPVVIGPPDSPEYPPKEVPSIKSADLFVHLPKKFVENRFDGVTKPGAGYADSGYVGPIYWHYETALLAQGLTLSLTNLWPLEFLLEIPCKALGGCGAGIKIGCIYYEAAGVTYNGEISPFEIYFALGQDVNAGELYFQSKLGSVVGHDFNFHHWPLVGEFPVDQIADFILAQVAQAVATSKSSEILNVTRFTLVDLGLVAAFGQMRNGMAGAKSASGESVTIGIGFTF